MADVMMLLKTHICSTLLLISTIFNQYFLLLYWHLNAPLV